jgi:hypothetical protein
VQAQGEERRELAKRTVNRERAAHARPLFQLLLRLTLAMSLLAMLARRLRMLLKSQRCLSWCLSTTIGRPKIAELLAANCCFRLPLACIQSDLMKSPEEPDQQYDWNWNSD